MKKIVILLIMIALWQYHSHGQTIGLANERDNLVNTPMIATPPANTGIAVIGTELGEELSHFDLVAMAFDDPTSLSYEIQWFDIKIGNLSNIVRDGVDPDVAFNYNADRTFVGMQSGGGIYLDEFSLIPVVPANVPSFSFESSNYVDDGEYPNIDISYDGSGVICWQNGGQVFAAAFTGPFVGPAVLIGDGEHPDVVLLQDVTTTVITYVDNGDWRITLFDYAALQSGSFSVIDDYSYAASGSPYDYPRIAAARNLSYIGSENFTVVAERDNGTGHNIEGVMHNGGGMVTVSPFLINSGLENCENAKPVVCYNLDIITIAWSTDYSSCTHTITPPNSTYTDVIYTLYDVNAMSLLSGDFLEVNYAQGQFYEGIPSINSKYDTQHPIVIDASNALEAIIYTDNTDVYWKHRSAGDKYRLAPSSKPGIESATEFNIRLVQNPVQSVIRLQSESFEGVNVRLMNNLGQEVELTNRVRNSRGEIAIGIGDLPQGLYFVQCQKGEANKLFKIVH